MQEGQETQNTQNESRESTTVNGDTTLNTTVEQPENKTPNKKRKRFGWQKGILKKRRRILGTPVTPVR